jgi:hypothetical protein
MSEKMLKIVLGVVGALAVVYIATAALGSGGGAPADGSAAGRELAKILASIDEAGVEAVRFLTPEDTVELRREGSGWSAGGYPADSALVASFWAAVEDAAVGDLVATNPANHERLGVAGENPRAIEFVLSGGKSTRLLVGHGGPTYPSAYVRLPDRNEVHLLRANLRTALDRSLDGWRDRTIVRVDTAAVRRIEVERDGERYTLARDTAGWTLDGGAANAVAVQGILGELANLQAVGFAPDSARPAEPNRRVTVLGEAGDTLATVSIGEGDGVYLLATTPGKTTVFELAAWRVDRLVPTRAEVEPEDG